MMESLKDLEKQRDALEKKLDIVNGKIDKIEAAEIKKKWGIYKGCVVRGINHRSRFRFKVRYINTRYADKPWVTAHRIKKDGTVSRLNSQLIDEWELEKS